MWIHHKVHIRGLNVAYMLGFPNDLVMDHILPCLVFACNLPLRGVSNDVYSMCDLCCLNREWRWPISFTPKYACFVLLNMIQEVLEVIDIGGWFEHKVLSKYNWYLELFKILFVCPPCMSLCLLVIPFLGLSIGDLLKEASYDGLHPHCHYNVCV